MKSIEKKAGDAHSLSAKPKKESNEIKSDYPLSEKDEVKQAEAKLRKRTKKNI